MPTTFLNSGYPQKYSQIILADYNGRQPVTYVQVPELIYPRGRFSIQEEMWSVAQTNPISDNKLTVQRRKPGPADKHIL